MSTHAVKKPASSKPLIVGVLVMTLVVLALGGAVVALKLRPETLPSGSIARAVASWEQVVAENPEDSGAQTGLGLALLDAGRAAEAQAAFEEALSLNEENWVAMLQLAILMQDADPDRAVELLGTAVKAANRTEKVQPAVTLGDLQMSLGNVDEAVDAYRIAVADAPFVIEGHLGLAKAYEELGENEKAVKEYRSAARFAPDHPDVVAGLERLGAEA
jgi:tetratricopeptide (TPR) repeat protein